MWYPTFWHFFQRKCQFAFSVRQIFLFNLHYSLCLGFFARPFLAQSKSSVVSLFFERFFFPFPSFSSLPLPSSFINLLPQHSFLFEHFHFHLAVTTLLPVYCWIALLLPLPPPLPLLFLFHWPFHILNMQAQMSTSSVIRRFCCCCCCLCVWASEPLSFHPHRG